MPRSAPKTKTPHRHLWLIEPLADDPTLLVRSMFGGKAVYHRGKFILFLADKDEPWRGVLLPTERVHQSSLMQERPELSPHPVLPKWLYLPESADSFESDARWIVTRAQQNDDRIGIIPPQKRSRRTIPPKPHRKRKKRG